MISKVAKWFFGAGKNEYEKTNVVSGNPGFEDTDVSYEHFSTPPSAPSPPPAPPKPVKNGNSWNGQTSQGSAFVTNGDLQIPKALRSTFDRKEKDKKPFSYFTQGQAPDLSSKPSPRQIRQSNPVLNGPPVPKVLPIVSQTDLEFEEIRQKYSKSPTNMPAVSNLAQYNTPIALYSNKSVQEELKKYPSNDQNLLLQTRISSRTPIQNVEYSDSEDYPKYKGYVNPNSQSPCFKRLQYITGMHTDFEDERPVEIQPCNVRSDEKRTTSTTVVSKSSSLHGDSANDQNIASYKVEENTHQKPGIVLEFQSSGMTRQPPYQNGVPYDPHVKSASIEDPVLSSKIAEAERPKVPPQVVPDWTRHAALKHEKWRDYADYQQTHMYEGPPVPKVQTQARWQQRSSSRTPTIQRKPIPSLHERAKSTEPTRPSYTQFGHSQVKKEAWMKPYVASNVVEPKLSQPLSIKTTPAPTPMMATYSKDAPSFTSSVQQQSHFYRSSSPIGQQTSYRMETKSSESETHQNSSPRHAPKYTLETTYPAPLHKRSDLRDIQKSAVSFSPRPWTPAPYQTFKAPTTPVTAPRAVPHGANSSVAVDPMQKSWHFETEAQQQQRRMELELAERASATSKPAASPGWQPATTERSVVSAGQAPTLTQKWQDANGASTKSQTTGNYVDKDGNSVTYVKEVYTTSDPGKEFSQLSQEERKVLEEPLQPGVVSRRVTTKYYKKSTYTSSTTTSATPSKAAISVAPSSAATLPRRLKTMSIETSY